MPCTCKGDEYYFCCRLRLANVILLGSSFCLLFVAFNAVQVLETTVNEGHGFASLLILYGVLAVFNLVTPAVIDLLGHRMSLFIGASTYVVFIVANIIFYYYEITAILFSGSALLGVGAALLWSAQGAFLTRCADKETLGLFNGLFFALFMANYIIGNILSGVLLTSGVSVGVLFTVFAVIGALATLSILLLRNVPRRLEAGESEVRLSTLQLLQSTLRLFGDKRLLLLVPLMIFSGLSQEFFFGTFPKEIGRESDVSQISFAMAVFGGAETIGSLLAGRISDRIGRLPVVLAMFVIHCGGLTLSLFASQSRSYMFYMATSLMGLGDSICNTQIYAVLGFLFPQCGEAAFSAFKLIQALTTAAAFAYGPYTGVFFAVMILYGWLVIGVLLFALLAKCVTPVDEVTSKKVVSLYDEVDGAYERTRLIVNKITD